MPTIRVAIHGAAGRMGQRLIAIGAADPHVTITAAVDSPKHSRLGDDAGAVAGIGSIGVPITGELAVPADVAIDFSVPAAVEGFVRKCVERGVPVVVATTGCSSDQVEIIRTAAKEIPVLWAPSMSRAVNVTMKLAEMAGQALKNQDADVEILERHHRFKEDSPSGTALKFGQIIAGAMGQTGVRHGREGRPGARPHNEIGYHAIRVGDNPGEHTIVFGMLGETIELTVRASNRDCYALGAYAAAKFLIGKPAGLYSMNDVLGL